MMLPTLYSFRRCPYAIRARLAIDVAQTPVYLREVKLSNKPQAFLEASPSGTVPCLVTPQRTVDESLDIMRWALGQNDPERWLDMPGAGEDLIAHCDGPFKHALDRTKYATRYPDEDPSAHRAVAAEFLAVLDRRISDHIFDRPTLADAALMPFVRQFAFIDKRWFDAQPWPDLQRWLARHLADPRFERVMIKLDPWAPGDPALPFPV